MDSKSNKIDLKAWMHEHPQEYGEFARDMGETDLMVIFLMAQAAFVASPEFHKQLEDMIDLDILDLEKLLKTLHESMLEKNTFINPGKNEEWEKCRLPFAAWMKHGKSSEMLIECIEDAISLTDNLQAKWQLSNLLKAVMKKEVNSSRRSREDLKNYIDYRNALSNDNITEWALNGMTEAEVVDPSPIKLSASNETDTSNLTALLASHDEEISIRIGTWINFHSKGIDMACLFVALIESGEIEPKLSLTKFMKALKLSFPKSKIVGVRQVQKDVNTLQSLSPNRKRYGKDEPMYRSKIDIIKDEILNITTQT